MITDKVSLMQWIAKLSGKNAEEVAQKTTEILQLFCIPFGISESYAQNPPHTIRFQEKKAIFAN